MKHDTPSLPDRLSNMAFLVAMKLVQMLPYERRVPLAGRLVARVAPVLGFTRRVRENLALTCPELPEDEVRRLERAVPDNLGRMLAEIYSGDEFLARVRDLPIEGPGAEALACAHDEGRPVVLAAGHFGNYDAWRGALSARGYRVGAIYRPMNNQAFNAQYVATISAIAQPLFSRSRRGLADMMRFLRDGGMVAFGFDQYFGQGADLTFFGQTARTPLSAAEMALKMEADLIPVYAIRQPDGLNFRIVVEPPVPHSDAETMTQALNDALEARVRDHMEQWLWIHRRWKQRRR
ncbi:lysophospholipid acyltransferase family protein [Thioclava sp. BHET1]|uniref:Lauroyl acyltransferase n=1 Tax=Thioclava dalianensis TaxID=1185766 RepID=A0A074TIZ4_9RHOB|nr:lysophospholipid acyltransferase family protein [Thioclava dalianensis]KEP71619.1 lauroyl acyltransferase [Thioclava dalianensis]TMV87788.1 lysophospholipid acyltransferase family protein [Thioclava sp. BHET1]SFN42979.1 KDO2-lipid IV(A) lauroyltransferase [Thioclava dalianensis]